MILGGLKSVLNGLKSITLKQAGLIDFIFTVHLDQQVILDKDGHER